MLKAHASVTLVAELMFVLSQQRTIYDHSINYLCDSLTLNRQHLLGACLAALSVTYGSGQCTSPQP